VKQIPLLYYLRKLPLLFNGHKISRCSKSVVLSIGLNLNRDFAAGQLSPCIHGRRPYLSQYIWTRNRWPRFRTNFRRLRTTKQFHATGGVILLQLCMFRYPQVSRKISMNQTFFSTACGGEFSDILKIRRGNGLNDLTWVFVFGSKR
jgi:hypothetical protein